MHIPTDYRFWTNASDYFHPDMSVFENFDQYLAACQACNIHLSLNLHRAPGYCINGIKLEKHSLWTDSEAQDAFVLLWEVFAQRYLGVPGDQLSFDLVNKPPEIGRRGMTRAAYEAIM